MRWNNLVNLIAGGTREREARDTLALYTRVRTLHEQSPYAGLELHDFVSDIILEACQEAELTPVPRLTNAIGFLIEGLLAAEGFFDGPPESPEISRLTTDEAVALRTRLARAERFLIDYKRKEAIWRDKVIVIVAGLMQYLPPTAFRDDWEAEEEPGEEIGAGVALIDLLEAPAEVIERLIITCFDEDITAADLLTPIREQFERRVCLASGIEWEKRHESSRKLVLPSTAPEKQPELLQQLYCDGTPFAPFFETALPFSIPFPARFEHTHIVGGSGHGKTQWLQTAIVRDLIDSVEDGRSVVVIDSQGDLINTVAHLDLLSPDHESGLADRVVLIDPNDVEFPAALNMFDVSRESLEELPLREREQLLNASVDLYEYFFGALLGAELTARQGIIFKYLARLLLEIPDASIHTFRQLMENGQPFRPYMEKLPPTARAFFEERFFDRSFNETKKQVLTRLWGVLSNTTFDRMFSHPRSKLDLFSALQDGKIIFINTAKDLLKEDGASILGRFFIALITQAAMRRAILPAHERTPTFVYIDEAADYFDDRIGHLLSQARKYKVGMVLAHQNLDQLSSSLRASVLANTSIKLAGGVSTKDAALLGSEMHTDAGFIQSQRKHRNATSFACYVRNVTSRALSVSIPLGSVEAMPHMDDAAFEKLREVSRERYCVPLAEMPQEAPPRAPEAAPPPEAPVRPSEAPSEPIPPRQAEEPEPPPKQHTDLPPRARTKVAAEPPPLGRGGREHQYLQNLIKEFAISKGFHAVVEAEILDGAGRVDVALKRDDLRIACEISVTTGRDHELQNIEKCLAAGYEHVLFVSADARHRAAMEKLTKEGLEEAFHAKVHFLDPEGALAFIGELADEETTDTTVRGYRVKVTQAVVDEEEAERRRARVASVIVRSIKGGDR
ncbi:MAG: hypothetical protein WDZ84_01445 [Rhodovibrionaceae bacterium]